MLIALAQINPIIGDWEGNYQLHIQAIQKAIEQQADLVVFPELSLCGYPPMDLLTYPSFVAQGAIYAEKLCKSYPQIAILIGMPIVNLAENQKSLFNASMWLCGGLMQVAAAKTLLPDYDVFNECRYFENNRQFSPILYKNKLIGVSICEDLWHDATGHYSINPIAKWQELGCDLHINMAASPFELNKQASKLSLLQQASKILNQPLIYVNQIGANTDLIFDGASCVLSPTGVCMLAPSFKADVYFWNLENETSLKQVIYETEMSQIEAALTLGISDFFAKNGFKKAVIGLSGGVDSALVTYLAAKALGPKNVTAILMPSAFSSEHSITDSLDLAKNLGIEVQTLSINTLYEGATTILAPYFANLPFSVAEENLQSRLRGLLLMAWSNKFGHILLNTTNKSELAVGYGTLYGDMCGALSVIGDLFKTQVYALCHHINENKIIIPKAILTKEPSAELRPNQKDIDSLPPYTQLDAILEAYLIKNWEEKELIDAGYDVQTVKRVLKLVKQAEFKRFQAAPVLKISSKAFGQGRVMPLVAKY